MKYRLIDFDAFDLQEIKKFPYTAVRNICSNFDFDAFDLQEIKRVRQSFNILTIFIL